MVYDSGSQGLLLNTSMERAKCMKARYKYFPHEIRQVYNLEKIVTLDGWMYILIVKDMYDLKQAALISYDLLKTRLATDGYITCIKNVNIWRHTTKPTKFSLCVDDFKTKYYSKVGAD